MSHSHVILSHPHAVCAASFVYIDWGRAGDSPHRLIPCLLAPSVLVRPAVAYVVQHVPTSQMVADALTKPLERQKVIEFRRLMGLVE